MPLKLNVGLSKKVGMPNYGSLAASCHVEVELDHGILFQDPEAWQHKVQQAFGACRDAVHLELDRGRTPTDADPAPSSLLGTASPANGHGDGQFPRLSRDPSRPATDRQLRAIEAIAFRQRLNLLELVESRFGKYHLAGLSRAEASELIEAMGAIRSPTAENASHSAQ